MGIERDFSYQKEPTQKHNDINNMIQYDTIKSGANRLYTYINTWPMLLLLFLPFFSFETYFNDKKICENFIVETHQNQFIKQKIIITL